ncbi:PAS domain S-box-containing protein/diguanylate cyclase (GGDEF)-like protein [Vibrio crassostreae]|uniref:sensor domain-containing diguanylate cyclase n=1 Tax=Vibrio crassostreae TaxID=246167 RepID=UPI000F4966AE|nr:sensor domain-containing diguanylate cyclase [Vibrio crassostreae]ROO75380.1 PAS domain S-box-containing protein/diguanylate cyclase (GGDEF)-like protein [Vibrio crassostreae]ROP13387.1 PAS domain S-box-containing protein/diguanylate cyclase (GGDEF)-like protein [Vibrio crassostreae]ROQ87462.1 PAS domain S-box-containing protein/diguanylate cyclase (GGDEF)-like protein [Vibrio crassostreae]ROR88167.1 PAS domain S-box-containing protein/diguanylate cyclase (GGDEF)-like protein [Vibrio crassos
MLQFMKCSESAELAMSSINFESTYGVITIQDMNVVSVDANYARIYGYQSPEELLSNIDSFLDLISEDYHVLAYQNYLETVSGQRDPQVHTYTNVDRNGREFTVFSIDHVTEWQGRPALQVTVIDLSPAIQLQNVVREQDKMYHDMIMQSGQGILVHRDFKPLMVNQSWVKLQGGTSIEQVLALDSILGLVPQQNTDGISKHYHAIVSGELSGTSTVVENIGFDGVHRFFNIYDNAIIWKGQPAVQVVLEDVTQKVMLEKQLVHQANYDEMTDLLNRRAIYEWLREHIISENYLVCMLLDIDDFKSINDTYGHMVGDEVICALANIAKRNADRVGGVAGRWGGEEFIIFIPNAPLELAYEVSEEIRQQFHHVEFKIDEQVRFNSSVSIGISDSRACEDGVTIDALVNLTDQSLYRAKANGKNCVDGDVVAL